MSLFGFGKKKETKAPECTCKRNEANAENENKDNECCCGLKAEEVRQFTENEKKDNKCCCGSKAEEVRQFAENEKKDNECSCGSKAEEVRQFAENASQCSGESADRIYCVKVLGSGCKSCHALYENAQKAVNSLGLSIEVEYVTDMEKVAGYGVMSMPALVVNEKVVSMGKVLNANEIKTLIN